LADGSVLVAGGVDAAGARLDALEIIDELRGATNVLGLRLPQAVTEHAASLISRGRVIISGGLGVGGSISSVIQAVDISNGHAVELSSLVEPRAGHTSTLLTDGHVLVVGGRGGRGAVDTAETWDGERLVSTLLSQRLTTARTAHTATLLPSGEVLIVGGLGANRRPLTTVEVFDPTSNVFRREPFALRTARAHHTATLLPTGEVFVWGGVDASGGHLATGEVLDSRTGAVREVQVPLAGVIRNQAGPALVASIPVDNAQGVSIRTSIGLRFSEPNRGDECHGR
jgi:hypothetical protein